MDVLSVAEARKLIRAIDYPLEDPMKCTECRSDNMKQKVLKKHLFMDKPRIYLAGVTEWTCKDCGEVYFDYPRMGELMNLVAKTVASQKRRLTGEEVGFLRSFVGLTMEELAEKCGVNKGTISRWESGKLTAQADKIFRFVIVAENYRKQGFEVPAQLLGLIADAKLEERKRIAPMMFESVGKRGQQHWTAFD